MLRTLALLVLLLSPSPVVCFYMAESVFENGTVRSIAGRLRRGEMTLIAQSGTPEANARQMWQDAHDVNFGVGLAFLVACASTIGLATSGALILRTTKAVQG